MKFTVAALLVASTSAVSLKDDCGGKWCNKGLAYDFDEPTRNAAHADMGAKTHAFNGATKSHDFVVGLGSTVESVGLGDHIGVGGVSGWLVEVVGETLVAPFATAVILEEDGVGASDEKS